MAHDTYINVILKPDLERLARDYIGWLREICLRMARWQLTSWRSRQPNSSVTRLAMDIAATCLGCVQPILPLDRVAGLGEVLPDIAATCLVRVQPILPNDRVAGLGEVLRYLRCLTRTSLTDDNKNVVIVNCLVDGKSSLNKLKKANTKSYKLEWTTSEQLNSKILFAHLDKFLF